MANLLAALFLICGCSATPSGRGSVTSAFVSAETCTAFEDCRAAFEAVTTDVYLHKWIPNDPTVHHFVGEDIKRWQSYADSMPSVFLVATSNLRETRRRVSFERAVALFNVDGRRLLYINKQFEYGRDVEAIDEAVSNTVRPGMTYLDFSEQLTRLGFELKIVDRDVRLIMEDHFEAQVLDGLQFDRGVIATILLYPQGGGQCRLSVSGPIGLDGTVLKIAREKAWLP